MSDSLQPHGLSSPWNSPGQNTGVGSLSLLQHYQERQELRGYPGFNHLLIAMKLVSDFTLLQKYQHLYSCSQKRAKPLKRAFISSFPSKCHMNAPNNKNLGALQVALVVKNSPANAGDTRNVGLISGLGRSPEGGHGNPLQYSCMEILHGQRSLAGYSPWDLQIVGHDGVSEDTIIRTHFTPEFCCREIRRCTPEGPPGGAWNSEYQSTRFTGR